MKQMNRLCAAHDVIWSYAAHTCYFYFFKANKTAIIYDARQGMENLVEEYKMDMKFDIRPVIDVKCSKAFLSVCSSLFNRIHHKTPAESVYHLCETIPNSIYHTTGQLSERMFFSEIYLYPPECLSYSGRQFHLA